MSERTALCLVLLGGTQGEEHVGDRTLIPTLLPFNALGRSGTVVTRAVLA